MSSDEREALDELWYAEQRVLARRKRWKTNGQAKRVRPKPPLLFTDEPIDDPELAADLAAWQREERSEA